MVQVLRDISQVFSMAPRGLDLNKLSFGFEMGRMSHLTIVMDVEGMGTIPFATFQSDFGGEQQPYVNNIAHVNWDQLLDAKGYNPQIDYLGPMIKFLTYQTVPVVSQADYMLMKDYERRITH